MTAVATDAAVPAPRRRVTFSRNVTLSLSRSCVSHCKYCAFATYRPHLHAPEEVETLIDGAARRGAKELLVLTGDDPGHHDGVRARLAELGFADFVAYVVWCCERALERGLLPHTNLGALSRGDLARLREVTASQGLMLESVRDDLVAHAGSPTKDPALRLQTIRAAGELRIPFTSGILVGIGETREDRLAGLEALAQVHAEHGHLQELILQNFVPHRRYYGEEPAQIAAEAAEAYWRTGIGAHPQLAGPAWACEVSVADMKELIAAARELLPGVGIQIPPNLADWWPELVTAGATDLGGLSANGDHISPEHPFPSPHRVRKALAPLGCALTERLCVYPQYLDPEWVAQGVLDVVKARYWSFIPRRGLGPAQRPADSAPPGSGCDPARARRGRAVGRGADGAVRGDAAGGDRGHPPGGGRAPRRGRRRHRDVRRQSQRQRLERVHRRMRVLWVRAGKAQPRRVPALGGDVPCEGSRRDRLWSHRSVHPVRHPPGLGA